MDLEEVEAKQLEEQQEAQQPEAEPPQELEQAYALAFIHEGVQYSQASARRALRQLCREYGVSKNGSKAEIRKRLSVAVQESSLRQRTQASQEQYRDHVEPFQLAAVEKPSQEEIDLHRLTHLPFRSWCAECVAAKSKESPHKILPAKSSQEEWPTIAVDFMFTSTTGCDDPPSVVLIGIDSWTRWVEAYPIPRKGGQQSTERCVEGLVQMSCQPGYSQVTIKGDNESTMKSFKKSFQQLRGMLALRTLIEDSIPHDHASNGLVERAIQIVRRQGNALLEDLRRRTKFALRQLLMLAQDQMKQPLIHQVQRNKKVTGMQQDLVQARLLRQSCARPWKMLQMNLKIQLCQKLLILLSHAEKKDQTWKEVQEAQKAPRTELHPPFFAGQVKAEDAFPHEDEMLEWYEEDDDFSEITTGIDEEELYNEAARPPVLSQEDL